CVFFFFSSRRRHTSFSRDWSSDVCSSDLFEGQLGELAERFEFVVESSGSLFTVKAQSDDPRHAELLVRAWIAAVESQVSQALERSEERRVGKGGERRCRARDLEIRMEQRH